MVAGGFVFVCHSGRVLALLELAFDDDRLAATALATTATPAARLGNTDRTVGRVERDRRSAGAESTADIQPLALAARERQIWIAPITMPFTVLRLDGRIDVGRQADAYAVR